MDKLIFDCKTGRVIEREFTAIELAEIEAQRLAEYEAAWMHKDRTIRVNLTDEQYVSLLIDYPEFAVLRQKLNIPVEPNNMGGEFLYLEELHDEDRQLFIYFGGTIENYKP